MGSRIRVELADVKVAAMSDALWVTGARAPGSEEFVLQRLDPSSGRIEREVRLPGVVRSIDSIGDRIWLSVVAAETARDRLLAVDARSAEITRSLDSDIALGWLSATNESVWSASLLRSSPTPVSAVHRIDPMDGTVHGLLEVQGSIASLQNDGTSPWCSLHGDDVLGDRILKLDPQLAETPEEVDLSTVDTSTHAIAAETVTRYEHDLVAAVERQIPFLRSAAGAAVNEVRIEGEYPRTALVVLFRSTAGGTPSDRQYGWRHPIWPPREPDVGEEAFVTVAVQLMERVAKGLVADEAPAGEVHWLA
jgi:hypothetical protein